MRTALLATCFVLGSLTAAAADPWRVVEGPKGETQGMWDITFTGSTADGNADMVDPRGQKVSYLLAGSLTDGRYDFERISSTDGSLCRYTGARRDDGKIAGTSDCPDGLGVWIADMALN